jgi:hypothetical protein
MGTVTFSEFPDFVTGWGLLQLVYLMILWYSFGTVTVSEFIDFVVQDGDC